jgi:hypothetical protein
MYLFPHMTILDISVIQLRYGDSFTTIHSLKLILEFLFICLLDGFRQENNGSSSCRFWLSYKLF